MAIYSIEYSQELLSEQYFNEALVDFFHIEIDPDKSIEQFTSFMADQAIRSKALTENVRKKLYEIISDNMEELYKKSNLQGFMPSGGKFKSINYVRAMFLVGGIYNINTYLIMIALRYICRKVGLGAIFNMIVKYVLEPINSNLGMSVAVKYGFEKEYREVLTIYKSSIVGINFLITGNTSSIAKSITGITFDNIRISVQSILMSEEFRKIAHLNDDPATVDKMSAIAYVISTILDMSFSIMIDMISI